MRYPLSAQIYDIIEKHRSPEKVRGNDATKRQMKNGTLNPTLRTVSELFKENDMPAELIITVREDGKTGKTKLPLKFIDNNKK